MTKKWEPWESRAAMMRSNVQIEVAERLNRAGIECSTGGSTNADDGFDIALGWPAARRLLRLLRAKGIGNP